MEEDLWAEIAPLKPNPSLWWTRPRADDGRGLDELVDSTLKRREFIARYGFAYPSPEAIDSIIRFAQGGRILEVGAGLGLWAALISHHGGDIIATDARQGWWWDEIGTLLQHWPSEHASAEAAVAEYPAKTLMLCWPPYDKPVAYQALRGFKGSRLIYIGEDEYGCTGDRQFFKLLNVGWRLINTLGIPQYEGLHDSVWLYERKAQPTKPARSFRRRVQ